MTNTPSPEDSGGPWNSDELVYDKMSCKELAKYCTSYMACLRMAVEMKSKFGPEGVIKLIMTVLEQQMALLNSSSLSQEERDKVSANSIIAIQAACMAACFAVERADPRHLAAVSVAAIDIVHGLGENQGPVGADDAIIIRVRKGEGGDEHGANIQMGAHMEPISTLANQLVEDGIGKEIKRIIKTTDASLDPDKANKFGLYHGNN